MAGCSCPGGPTYYVVVRTGSKSLKTRVGKDRHEAQRELLRTEVEIDDGDFQPLARITFADWGEHWLDRLERKESTIASYGPTIRYAAAVFGSKPVRDLRAQDISDLNAFLRKRGVGASSRAKHLRVLGACLQSALQHGHTKRNAVRDLPRSEKPRAERRESAYFENEELPRLFAEVPPGPHRMLFLLALKTGMRLGELLALQWGDVDLSEAVIRVRRSYTGRALSTPKNHERRDVDLTSDLVDELGAWWGESGRPTDPTMLVFPGEDANGYLTGSNILRRHLYPAMERAGLPRIGVTGEPRVFHSFRHTFAKRALETGAQLSWLSRHLGHSSLKVTTDIYGHWERAERRAQVKRMEGVFGV